MVELGQTTDLPVTALGGVGPKIAERLKRLGISQARDLLFLLPLRYEDRTAIHPIAGLQVGQRVLIEGEVLGSAVLRGRRAMLVWQLGDDSGQITMRMFNFFPNQQRALRRGVRLRCFGEVRPGYRGLEMIHPEYTRIEADHSAALETSLTPIYPATEGVGQALLRRLTDQALALMVDLEELLPTSLLAAGLPGLAQSLQIVHRPPPDVDLAALAHGSHPAQKRLAFEELLAHRLSLRLLRRRTRQQQAPELVPTSDLAEAFLAALPFRLTGAQGRVIDEITADLARPVPAMRLVQGDVGSGKTVVAAMAVLFCIASGWQAVLAAPTEILAEQHLRNFEQWFQPLGLEVAWLSGRVKGKRRVRVLDRIAGEADLVIGTHALIEEDVRFGKLGLVVVDEQHRFGVHQRLALRNKGREQQRAPHQIIMTATPIPRTLAMTSYADLDVSTIDELPPQRKPVKTVALSNQRRQEVIERVQGALAQGHQAYWVCTLIEESEALQAEAAQDIAMSLQAELPDFRIDLVHGRLKADQKQTLMADFKQGQLQLLVATTVIEVGVDVSNASLMIIENAERLGLSQLHQLRGRVGRGSTQATCVLLYQAPLSQMARQRLAVMRESNDGFEIARQDLELRGPGEVLGTRQTGTMQFRIADLARDRDLLDQVRQTSDAVLQQMPELAPALVRRWIGDSAGFAQV